MAIVPRAFLWNVEAALRELTAWKNWTPSITQSGNVTKTVTLARYRTIGTSTRLEVYLTVTGAGTGNNPIYIGDLPKTMANASSYKAIGIAEIVDISGITPYVCSVLPQSTTSLRFMTGTTDSSVGVSPNFALAVGDLIGFTCEYENA